MGFGYHVDRNGDLASSITSAKSLCSEFNIQMGACQIFVQSPMSRKILTHHNVAEVTRNMQLIVHSSYINAPWGNPAGARGVARELNTAEELNALGVVIHMNSRMPANLESTICNIYNEISKPVPILYLEINAAKPEKSFCDNLAQYAERAQNCTNHKIGICIDTAHLCACGVTLTHAEDAADFMDDLPQQLPIMIHLNDSAALPGSGLDRHAPLFTGHVWKSLAGNKQSVLSSGCAYLFKWANDNDAPIILERDEQDITHDLSIISRYSLW